RRRNTTSNRDWSSDVCSSDLGNDVVRAPELVHRLIEDLVHDLRARDLSFLELIPGRGRRPEQIGHEREESHQQERRDETVVVIRSEERRVGKEGGCGWGGRVE